MDLKFLWLRLRRSNPMNSTLLLRGMRRNLALGALCALASLPSFGQAAPASGPPLAFEVATIKPSDGTLFRITPPGAQQTYRTAGMVRNLVAQAYKTPSKLVFGGPDWADKDVFRIEAQIPGELFTKMQN